VRFSTNKDTEVPVEVVQSLSNYILTYALLGETRSGQVRIEEAV